MCRCTLDSKSPSTVGEQVFSVTSSSKYGFDYLGQSTKGDLNLNYDHLDSIGIDPQVTLEGPIEDVAWLKAQEAEDLLRDLGILSPFSARNSPRGIFCSRTLNLRSISAIGYDMDYTLIHYNVMAWEGRAYDYCMDNLRNMGFPVDGLAFDPDLVIRGLVIDKERGNLVKADRFGYVKRAMHGTKMLSTQAVSEMYGRELVDLRKESRWEFLNTLFSVSEAVAYMQMVDRLDEGAIAAELGPLDYKGLYKAVGKALFRAHVEGQLKSEIMSKPELFVEPDPELPLALLDQKEAGKKLLLITNSDYHYTDKMMKHSFNRFLPNDMDWRDLFDMSRLGSQSSFKCRPLYEVVTGEGLMRPCFKARTGGLYSGGSAQMVENSLNIHGDEILYVGDHIYTDVSQSKVHLRWRTALICRELEEEYTALIRSRDHRAALIELINQKEVVGDLFNQLRLALQRRNKERPAQAIHFITFYAPLWGAILYNGFTYFQVIRMLNNATRMAVGMSDRAYQFDARPDMKALNRWGYYPLILIGSWAFGTINRIHDFVAPGHKILWLSVLDVGTAALMGLFNSIAYGLNSSVRRAICERLDLFWPDRLRRWFPPGFKFRNQVQESELVSLKIQDQH
ncbi:hypothetical protein GH714_007951 [Hevea brasiliensis]|uniref:Uncharacterized protein n=1 Tax=Hevea brasiliensis TaxID=3981 RepID=A0A6A6MAR1_HEVBR|nr:hypothetical protein GH714_007951 [Hevea brasiliensis]